MGRRGLASGLLGCVVALTLAGAGRADDARRPPNIVFILADDKD
jgi:hypothetical protein